MFFRHTEGFVYLNDRLRYFFNVASWKIDHAKYLPSEYPMLRYRIGNSWFVKCIIKHMFYKVKDNKEKLEEIYLSNWVGTVLYMAKLQLISLVMRVDIRCCTDFLSVNNSNKKVTLVNNNTHTMWLIIYLINTISNSGRTSGKTIVQILTLLIIW